MGNSINRTVTTRTRTQRFRTFEAELEGWNAEVGFLIPGLDRYIETRVFGGYYQYNHPFAADYEGFKARLEAHFLPGVIGNVEWWNDSYPNGGHWTAERSRVRCRSRSSICSAAVIRLKARVRPSVRASANSASASATWSSAPTASRR